MKILRLRLPFVWPPQEAAVWSRGQSEASPGPCRAASFCAQIMWQNLQCYDMKRKEKRKKREANTVNELVKDQKSNYFITMT
jgi:hypothetical protein